MSASAGLVLAIAVGGTVIGGMVIGGTVGWWAARCRRERHRRRVTKAERPIHRFRGQGEAITVAELLEEAAEENHGVRLNWPRDDLYASPIRPDDQGQFPTVILPRIGSESA